VSSIEKFIEYVADSYGRDKGISKAQVDVIFASGDIPAIIRMYPSPFVSHSQKWRNAYIDRCIARAQQR
jgi:hypothetical protein